VSFDVRETRRFARQYKKLHGNIVVDVDAAVETVAENPAVGARKKGDLADCWFSNSTLRGSFTCWAIPLMMVFG
jgi:hypothetical protein